MLTSSNKLIQACRRNRAIMGCTSSILTVQSKQQPQIHPPHSKKETAYIELIVPNSEAQGQPVQSANQELVSVEIINTKMKRQKQKIQFLQQSHNFMRESVQISNYVNQAILSLTYNPLLHDEAYYKLIGMNKKTLEKKQNRINNLLKREEKAEHQLKKQREKRLEKTKSEIISYRFNTKERRAKQHNKQNREESIYHTHSKQSFAQRMSKIQTSLFDSEKNIS